MPTIKPSFQNIFFLVKGKRNILVKMLFFFIIKNISKLSQKIPAIIFYIISFTKKIKYGNKTDYIFYFFKNSFFVNTMINLLF